MDDLFGVAQMQNDMMMQQEMMMQQQEMLMQQNLLMQQQDIMGMQPNQMYNMQPSPMYGMQNMYQQPIASYDRFGFAKYSRQQYLNILRNYVIQNCQVAISKEQPILEVPNMIRHCCVECSTKIVMLPKFCCTVPETNMQIPFYFCRDCGKLFYYKDFAL